jgi:hypothetical protein
MNCMFCTQRNVCQIDTTTVNLKDMGTLGEIKHLTTNISIAIINTQKYNNKSTIVLWNFNHMQF